MYRFPTVALTALVLSSASTAADRHAARYPKVSLSAEGNRCLNSGKAAQGVIGAMEDCITAEFNKQDARLNAVFKQAMRRLQPARQTELRQSERAWLLGLPGKVSRCTYPWGKDGRMYGFATTHCQTMFVVERAEWLERHYPMSK